jgi:hypothetical protein
MLHIRITPVQIETLPNTCRTPPTAASAKTPCQLSLRDRGTRVKSRTSKTGQTCRKETRCSPAVIAQRVPLSTSKLQVNKMIQHNTNTAEGETVECSNKASVLNNIVGRVAQSV